MNLLCGALGVIAVFKGWLDLATPACAMICGSFAVISYLDINNIVGAFTESTWMIPAGSAILSFLLVSEIPTFSMKFKKGAASELIWMRLTFIAVAVIALIVTIILGQHFSHVVLFIFLAYIIINLIHNLFHR